MHFHSHSMKHIIVILPVYEWENTNTLKKMSAIILELSSELNPALQGQWFYPQNQGMSSLKYAMGGSTASTVNSKRAD